MIAATNTWLAWCADHTVHPFAPTLDVLRHAASELLSRGMPRQDAIDLVDQTGYMTGLWQTPEWAQLRRDIGEEGGHAGP